jgi:hypothetical protein
VDDNDVKESDRQSKQQQQTESVLANSRHCMDAAPRLLLFHTMLVID